VDVERTTAPSETTAAQDEVRDRLIADPEVRRRLEDGLARLRRGETLGAGVTREELQRLLRDAE
jgi:hypothetical protein